MKSIERVFDTNSIVDAYEFIDDSVNDLIPNDSYDEHNMWSGDIKITIEYIPAS